MSRKVKDLPKDTNLRKVAVRIPKDVLEKLQDYGGGESVMRVGGQMGEDFFMESIEDYEGKKNTHQIYPMPPWFNPGDILEWEVVEKYTKIELIVKDDWIASMYPTGPAWTGD